MGFSVVRGLSNTDRTTTPRLSVLEQDVMNSQIHDNLIFEMLTIVLRKVLTPVVLEFRCFPQSRLQLAEIASAYS